MITCIGYNKGKSCFLTFIFMASLLFSRCNYEKSNKKKPINYKTSINVPVTISANVNNVPFYKSKEKLFIKTKNFAGINLNWAEDIHIRQSFVLSASKKNIPNEIKERFLNNTDTKKDYLNALYRWINGKIFTCNTSAPMIAMARLFKWSNVEIIKAAKSLRLAYRFGRPGSGKLTKKQLKFISSFIKEPKTDADRNHNARIINFCMRMTIVPVNAEELKQALINKKRLVQRNKEYYLTVNRNTEQLASGMLTRYEYDCEIRKMHVDTIRSIYGNLVDIEPMKYKGTEEFIKTVKSNFNENTAIIIYTKIHILNIVGYYFDRANKKFEIYTTETLENKYSGAYNSITVRFRKGIFSKGGYLYILRKK